MVIDAQTGSLAELIHHIVATHHEYLRCALPRVSARIGGLHKANGGELNTILDALDRIYSAMRDELEMHMHKEEIVLFPFIERLERAVTDGSPRPAAPFGSVGNPIRMMEREHESALAALAAMLQLRAENPLPPDAVDPYWALFGELEDLERDLQTHIHLENDILFPRAIRMERGA